LKHSDGFDVGTGMTYFDFDRKLFQMNLARMSKDKSISYLTLMTKRAPGKKSYILYAITGPSKKNLQCTVWGHINDTIIPDHFVIPEKATLEGFEQKNGEHSTKWSFIVANPKPIFHQYDYLKMDMHFTVYLSRFDQSLVHVEVTPNPLGGTLSISTLDLYYDLPDEFIQQNGEFELPHICQRISNSK
jgi:hypothetical protein